MDSIRDSGGLAALLLLDLSAAFDLVDHATLCEQLGHTVNVSPEATSWIASFLSDRTSQVFSADNSASPCPISCGVPQGSCVSPTLCNIYTKPLFDELDSLGVTYTNFADDTQILVPISGNHTSDSTALNSIYELVQAWMAKHHLCLNDDKTELLIVGTPHKLKSLSPEFTSFLIADNVIPVSKCVKTLGVYLDAELSMTRQVNAIASSSAYYLKLINAIRPFLSADNCATIARAIIGAKLDYCNVLLCGTTKHNLNKLQTTQNNAVRAALGLGRRDHVSEARRGLHWLPVRQRIAFKTLSITHRCLANTAPRYLSTCIQRRPITRSLRSTHENSLAVPRFARKRAGGTSFKVLAPGMWNALPDHIRVEPSYWAFRKALKTHLFC